jgi:hypothetical protein
MMRSFSLKDIVLPLGDILGIFEDENCMKEKLWKVMM